MLMHDYNKEGKKIVLLLHPMLANGKMMYELIGKNLGEDVRCLAPDFRSHGDEQAKEYVSGDIEVEEILAYLKENKIDHFDLVYGASLGGVILTKLIKKGIKFNYAFFEGTSFYENSKLMTKLLSHIFIKKHARAVADYDRAVTAMGELYGKAYAVDFAVQFRGMSEASIRNIAKDCGNNLHASLSLDDQKKLVFSYGTKDFNYSKAKKGCKKYYPNAKFLSFEGLDHCEKIVIDNLEYSRMLKEYLS